MLKNLEKRLEDHGITLEISDEAKAHLVDKDTTRNTAQDR